MEVESKGLLNSNSVVQTETEESDINDIGSQASVSDPQQDTGTLSSTESSSETLNAGCQTSKPVFDQARDVNKSIDLTDVTELGSGYDDADSSCDTKDPGAYHASNAETSDRETFTLPDFTKGSWYKHKCFQKYWDHYRKSMDWSKKHFKVWKDLQQRVNPSPVSSNDYYNYWCNIYRQSQFWNWPYQYPTPYSYFPMQTPDQQSSGSKKKRKRKKKNRRHEPVSSTTSVHAEDTSSEVFEMEITQDMMDFFAKSEEHRKQREVEKKENGDDKEVENHINVENVKPSTSKGPSVEAPKERPGARRTAEMKLLYGKGAAMIHGMETAIQMTFDRNTDIKQPKVWPNMPLKLVFS